jgi:hypothetical protein
MIWLPAAGNMLRGTLVQSCLGVGEVVEHWPWKGPSSVASDRSTADDENRAALPKAPCASRLPRILAADRSWLTVCCLQGGGQGRRQRVAGGQQRPHPQAVAERQGER